jgi:heme oxygenase (mycobilin-producing)
MQPSVDDPLVNRAGTPQDAVVLAATRDLLWIETPADARTTALRLVDELGGTVIAPDAAGAAALPIDLSFGVGDPVVPSAPADSVAHLLLSRHLPGFVRDANRAVELASRAQRLARDADIDALTGLPNRRVISGTVRARDVAGRYGGEEFLIVLDAPTDQAGVEAFLERLLATWEEQRPHPVTFSAVIARVGPDHGDAVGLADAAMYAAKRAGRSRWSWSGAVEPTVELGDPWPSAASAAGFVAHSLLSVPVTGRRALLAAFADRRRRVDAWPGFQRLEVWGDRSDPTSFVMVSWWDDDAAFRAYMASDDHRDSHARIPTGGSRPRPERFTSYEVVTR